ncbi:MAG: electron transport complex subunit RsxE [Treponema sp.]|jgi:electron transport complex protein RnfE|nr:electron transport complex subunit RsxE [Treponema sp.]
MKEFFRIFKNGIIRENPLLILMIGLCSALAVTTSVANGIGMGLSMTFVLLMSEIVICLFKRAIPNSIRIPIFIIVIAAFTTVIDYVLKAYFPDLSKSLGIFIPLIVVNCVIMGRVEGFASKQKLSNSIADALGMGLGFTWVLVAISLMRELLGSGTILDFEVFNPLISFINNSFKFINLGAYEPMLFFILPPGGFFVFALFISLNLFIKSKLKIVTPNVGDGCCGCAANNECPVKGGNS